MTSPPQCFCQQTIEGPLEEGTRVLNGVWSDLLMPSEKIKKEPAPNHVEWGPLVYPEKTNGVLCLEMPHHSCSCWHGGELRVENLDADVTELESGHQHLSVSTPHTLIPYLWTRCLPWLGRDLSSFLFFLPQEAFVTGKAAQETSLSITKAWHGRCFHIYAHYLPPVKTNLLCLQLLIFIAQIVHIHVLWFRKTKFRDASEIFLHGHLLPATKPKALPKDDIVTVWGMYPSSQFFAWFAFA